MEDYTKVFMDQQFGPSPPKNELTHSLCSLYQNHVKLALVEKAYQTTNNNQQQTINRLLEETFTPYRLRLEKEASQKVGEVYANKSTENLFATKLFNNATITTQAEKQVLSSSKSITNNTFLQAIFTKRPVLNATLAQYQQYEKEKAAPPPKPKPVKSVSIVTPPARPPLPARNQNVPLTRNMMNIQQPTTVFDDSQDYQEDSQEEVVEEKKSDFMSALHLKSIKDKEKNKGGSSSTNTAPRRPNNNGRFDPASSILNAIEDSKKSGTSSSTSSSSSSTSSSQGADKKRKRFTPPLLKKEEEKEPKKQKTNPVAEETLAKDGKRSPFLADGNLVPELAALDKQYVEMIMNEILDIDINVTWDDIAGLNNAKDAVMEAVIWPLLRPDIFQGVRAPPKGMMLFGPPGTGKTLIGKAIANESKSTFFSISASSLMSKWVGEGEKLVRTLFAIARFRQPSVIFIDEIDSMLAKRTESESSDVSRRMKTEFLVQLDGAGTNADDRILIVGATNRPQELDEAVRRRLVKRLYIPLPDGDARIDLIKRLLHKLPEGQKIDLTEVDFEKIKELSEGYSGSDLKALVQDATFGPIRDLAKGRILSVTVHEIRPIDIRDFESAFKLIRPSVDQEGVKFYEEWNKQFGSFAL